MNPLKMHQKTTNVPGLFSRPGTPLKNQTATLLWYRRSIHSAAAASAACAAG